jgi:hypothetical protein
MGQTIDELLTLGKERGYLTFAEVNAVLPDGIAPQEVDKLLLRFEELGIELIDEQDRPPRKIKVRRYCRGPELEQALRPAGVEFTDLICRRDASGAIFDARLIVPGAQAVACWWKIRRLLPELGHWPVITDRAPAPLYGEPLTPDDPTPPLSAPGVEIEYADPDEERDNARRLIAEADRLVPDPRTFHRWHYGAYENLSAEEWDELCQGPDEPDLVVTAEAGDLFGDQTPFRAHLDALSDEPFPYVEIDLTPTPVVWEVFAYRPYGGWNGAPHPAEQLTMIRHWHERHGAEMVSVPGDWFEMYVPRPPRARADALQLIREMTGFGEETIFGYQAHSLDWMIERVRSSHYWYFWWD